MRKLLLVLGILFSAGATLAQNTTVTATVVDANANPYALGTVSAQIVAPTGIVAPTLNGVPVPFSTSPAPLDATGHFSIVLPDNLVVLPSGTQYTFKICAPPVNIGPLGNQTPTQVCFAAGPFIITGASIDLSVQLNARAPLLGPAQGTGTGGGSPPAGLIGSLQYRASTTLFGGSNLSYNPVGNPLTGGSYLSTNDDLFGLKLAALGDSSYFTLSHSLATWSNGLGISTVVSPFGVQISLLVPGNCVNVSPDRHLQDSGAPCPQGGSLIFSNNVWTGTNQFNANTAFGGPNPWIDLSVYGLYQGTGAALTCSTASGSATLACPGGTGDFSVNQGIEIPLAGPASTFEPWGTTIIDSFSRTGNVATYHVQNVIVGPPQTITITGLANSSFNGTFTITGMDGDLNHFTVANAGANVGTTAGSGLGTLTSPVVVVTPGGVLNGTTRVDYKIVLRGYNGELSAASPAGTTLVGAVPGVNTIPVTGCARTAGVVTCTTPAPHNIQNGSTIVLSGTSTSFYDGQHQVTSIPLTTTFTYSANGQADDPNPPSGGNVQIVAKNTIQWNMQQGKTLQSLIYRSFDSGATYQLVGIAEGMDASFVDWDAVAYNGIAPQASYISATVPAAAPVNGILAARIQTISGSNVTLAGVTATATVVSQPAKHDNSPVVIAGCAAIGNGVSGTLYIPSGGNVPFNSVLNLRDNCPYPTGTNKYRLNVNGSQLLVNEPIVLRDIQNYLECVGGGGPLLALSTGITCEITGNAYPLVYVPIGNGPTSLKNFLMNCTKAYQSCVVEDQDSGKKGTVNTDYDNVYFNGVAGSMPFIARGGGFFHRWRRGAFSTGNAYGIPEALLVTVPNALGVSGGGLILGGNMMFDQTTFLGKGVLYESWNNSGLSAGFTTYMHNLFESGTSPLIRFNGPISVTGFDIIDPAPSDAINAATPLIELGTSVISATRVFNPSIGTFQPLFADGGGGIEIIGDTALIGASSYIQHGYANSASSIYSNGSVGIKGTGAFFAQMVVPAPVASLVASAGGSVPTGTVFYSLVATDVLGNPTSPSLQTGITVVGGTQTVTITPPALPVGATGWRVYRNVGPVTISGVLLACGQLVTPLVPGVPFVDTSPVACGNSAPNSNFAGTSILSLNGYSGPSVTLLDTVPTNPASTGTAKIGFHLGALTCNNFNGSTCMPTSFPALPIHPASVPWMATSTPSGGVGGPVAFLLAGVPVDFITAASYAIIGADRGHRKSFSNAGAVAVSLPQAGTGAGTDADFTSNFVLVLRNYGAGTVTVTAAGGSTFDHSGATTLAIITGKTCFIWSDNTNYESGCF